MSTEPDSGAPSKHVDKDDDEETNAILAELEAETEDTTSVAYQQRKSELQSQISNSAGYGFSGIPSTNLQDLYLTLKSDEDTLRFTTEHERAIVHFRHPDFTRCAIMDEHLNKVAESHGLAEAGGDEAAFARVDVANAPFVVEKLGVKILPCVIGFSKGVVKGKLIGFEGICWNGKEKDAKVSTALEKLLFSWGVITQKLLDDIENDSEGQSTDEEKQGINASRRRGIQGAKKRIVDDDDDWD